MTATRAVRQPVAAGAAAGTGAKGRILYLSHEALFFTTHRMPVALAMRDAGFEVHVAAPPDPQGMARIAAAGLAFHPIPLARGGRNPLAELRLLAAISYIVGQIEPALVHHVSMKPVIWGGIATRLLGVPSVVHAITGLGYLFIRSGPLAWAQRQAVKLLFRFALGHGNGRVIFQNGDDRDLFLRHGMVRDDRVVMIRGCGVDMAEFSPAPEPDGPAVVVFPARLIGDKGLNEFIAAVRILKDRGVTARFVLVGRHDPQNPTGISAAQVEGWQREGLVEVQGYSETMPQTLNAAHIVCLPSYREGLPRTLIEAAACGRAIVTTDVPGCREVVRHGENGLLVPVRDGIALAEALATLLADPDRRRAMAARGRAIALAEFSVERFVAESLDCYRAILPPAQRP